MKSTHRIIPAALLLFPLARLAHAAPTPSRNHTVEEGKAAASTEPYRLTLSMTDHFPAIALNLANRSRHKTLVVRWVPPYDYVFEAQYKTPADNPYLETGWKWLTQFPPASHVVPGAKPGDDGSLAVTEEHVEKIVIPPGQQASFSFLPNFPIVEQGFYRIQAVLTVPECYDVDTAAGPRATGRSFTLVVRSEPFIIRHTADGYVPVSAPPTKPAPPQ